MASLQFYCIFYPAVHRLEEARRHLAMESERWGQTYVVSVSRSTGFGWVKTPFERFEAFAKRLLTVPKQELDEELAKEKRVKIGTAKGSQDEEGTKVPSKV